MPTSAKKQPSGGSAPSIHYLKKLWQGTANHLSSAGLRRLPAAR